MTKRYLRTRPLWAQVFVLYCLALLLLLVMEQITFAAAAVPFTLTTSSTRLNLRIDGSSLHVPLSSAPTQILFVRGDPAVREFQLDGTDSINNFSLNVTYIHQIENTAYYRLQAWMRDVDSYSAWRDITIRASSSGRLTDSIADANTSTLLPLPEGGAVVTASIGRLEVPVQIEVICGNNPCGSIEVDRNDRFVQLQSLHPDGNLLATQKTYFPVDALPFIADVANLLIHVLIWSLLVLGAVVLLELASLPLLDNLTSLRPVREALRRLRGQLQAARQGAGRLRERLTRAVWLSWFDRFDLVDLAALVIVLAAFGATIWIALVEYHAEPHILDASAYIFQAKIFASGRLSVPIPVNLGAFQGPFMVADQGRWFAQYPPGTSALLALGLLVHLPWLVEPLLGALALFGIYKLGRLLFSPATALLAVLLAALSAFYLYLAASYLSHTIALFFGVYFLLALLHFEVTHRRYQLAIAAVCAGGLLLTRELSMVLVCGGSSLFLVLLHRRQWWRDRAEIIRAAVIPLGILGAFGLLYLAYDALQTGSPFLLPRTVFNPSDRYGFGQGIGFYGQHTVAAGFVNLDQLLTILLIDLYGWPFYLTLAFIPLAFLRRLRDLEWDFFCLAMATLLIFAQVGYFYHGIYLGPRYLFDALPFLLLLTARGITGLSRALAALGGRVAPLVGMAGRRLSAYAPVAALVLVLISCDIFYYLPRQATLYQNYTGLPVTEPLQVAKVYAFHPQHAIVLTNDWFIYNYVLFPLNDPDLNGKTLYAFAPSSTVISQLEAQYPSRTIYLLQVGLQGKVSFVKVTP